MLALVLAQIMPLAVAGVTPSGPAGFLAGLAHGAMMPAALPSLALGRDMPIFATNHAGVSYKLGYTLGVNLCGAVFFGLLFRRPGRTTGTPSS